jgi:phosphate butyryltransferase
MTGALVEGPVALDVAVNKRAALQKGIDDPVASNADLLLVPGVEVGSLLVGGIVHFARGRTATVILGAGIPLVSVHRKTPQERIHSLALACYALSSKN